jgi:hypothetical protein
VSDYGVLSKGYALFMLFIRCGIGASEIKKTDVTYVEKQVQMGQKCNFKFLPPPPPQDKISITIESLAE